MDTLCLGGLGLVVAIAISRAVAGLFFGISAAGPATFGVVSILLIGVGLVASWVPAFRASRVDPCRSHVALRGA